MSHTHTHSHSMCTHKICLSPSTTHTYTYVHTCNLTHGKSIECWHTNKQNDKILSPCLIINNRQTMTVALHWKEVAHNWSLMLDRPVTRAREPACGRQWTVVDWWVCLCSPAWDEGQSPEWDAALSLTVTLVHYTQTDTHSFLHQPLQSFSAAVANTRLSQSSLWDFTQVIAHTATRMHTCWLLYWGALVDLMPTDRRTISGRV